MKHFMKLNKEPFDAISAGDKTIELRLFDEKRRLLNVGDIIEFSCTGVDHTILAEAKALYVFKDFKELYAALPLEKCGYKDNADKADYADMYVYYDKNKIEKYGVVGIELKNVKKSSF